MGVLLDTAVVPRQNRAEAIDAAMRYATVAFIAASQRPGAFAACATPSRAPAWKTIPSWYLVATNDHTIPPTAERVMAARAGAHTIEIRSSHVAMISHPDATTRLILEAATSH
jgi:pimeloyl-ACP methyl ester carboxylesterase